MIIEDRRTNDIEVKPGGRYISLQQDNDLITVGQQQARQLIEVLQKWLDGEEVE